MKNVRKKNITRGLRKSRIHTRTRGTVGRPRLSIFRSNTNLYVQLIDDVSGKTIASASLKEVKIDTAEKVGVRVAKALALGKAIAEKAKKAGVTAIVFDRGQYAYHGRVKAVADGAREGGLKF